MSTVKVSNISGFSGSDILINSPDYMLVSGTLVISGADSEFTIPAGTQTQRPGSPSEGMIRYNTTTGYIEVYNDTDWVNIVNVTDTEAAGSTGGGGGSSNQDNDVPGSTYTDTDIVTSGLVSHIDVGNKASYRGVGSTIYNLVTNAGVGDFQIDGTAYYDDSYNGTLRFDDGHLYSDSATHYNQMSYDMWITQWEQVPDDAYAIIFNREDIFELSAGDRSLKWAVYASNQSWFWESTGCTMPMGKPIHIGLSYDGGAVRFYMNGHLTHYYDYPDGGNLNTNSNGYHKFNGRSDGQGTRGAPGKFTLHQWRIYNRGLTEAEWKQNYNATCTRFGHPQVPTSTTAAYTTSNLLLHIDSRYDASFIGGTGTIANLGILNSTNDMRGALNEMSNKPAYVRINGVDGGAVRSFQTNDTGQNRITVRNFPRPGTNRTYEIWIKPITGIGWQTWFDDTNERILFGTSTNVIQVYPDVTIQTTLDADSWQQVAYTISGTTCVVYKNGAQVGTGTYSSTLNSGTGDLWIGGDGGSESSNMSFTIARVYNRALTGDEIFANYQADKASHGLE